MVFQEIKNYAKCVVANKVTLAGYISLGTAFLTSYIACKTKIPEAGVVSMLSLGLPGFFMLSATGFAINDLDDYPKTASVKLTKREKGLEKLVKK